MSYSFRTAETNDDFSSIRRLNHQIFSEDSANLRRPPRWPLADPFESHDWPYLIALHHDLVAGMVGVRMTIRPGRHQTPPSRSRHSGRIAAAACWKFVSRPGARAPQSSGVGPACWLACSRMLWSAATAP